MVGPAPSPLVRPASPLRGRPVGSDRKRVSRKKTKKHRNIKAKRPKGASARRRLTSPIEQKQCKDNQRHWHPHLGEGPPGGPLGRHCGSHNVEAKPRAGEYGQSDSKQLNEHGIL